MFPLLVVSKTAPTIRPNRGAIRVVSSPEDVEALTADFIGVEIEGVLVIDAVGLRGVEVLGGFVEGFSGSLVVVISDESPTQRFLSLFASFERADVAVLEQESDSPRVVLDKLSDVEGEGAVQAIVRAAPTLLEPWSVFESSRLPRRDRIMDLFWRAR